jgi:membrane-associated phospholipid phosphatase
VLDIGLVAGAFLLYSVVRTFSAGRGGEALGNAMSLVELEQGLGLFWEADLQRHILSNMPLIKFFNAVYTYGHMPLVAVVGLVLFFFNRPHYKLFRNAILISGAIALLIYNVFPMAPPRLLSWPYGTIDTLSMFQQVNYHSAGSFINQYAAMPSMHVAWNLLASLAVVTTTANVLARTAGMTMPVLMSMAVVVTGNHFILDVFAGYMVAGAGLGLALLYRDHGWRIYRPFQGSGRQPLSA